MTAVAETVTIESSPTAESSAKEETQASSVKEETTKASTENSQVTTDTSQEEETKEAEKQAETTVDSKTEEPSNGINPLNKSLQNPPTVSSKANVPIPTETFDFAVVDEENNGVVLTTPITADRQWVQAGGANGLVGSVKSFENSIAYAGKNVSFNRLAIPEMTYSNTSAFSYGLRNITITLPKWYKGLSFIKPSYSIYPASFVNIYNNNGQQIDTTTSYIVDKEYAGTSIKVISQPNVYQVSQPNDAGVGATPITFNSIYNIRSTASSAYTKIKIEPNALTNNYRVVYMYTTKRKVTENFVDTNGAKITPPTGFTQGKQTAITSDPYTFKQAGTLPDTYTTGGKTYKFKGWYKGKTKPSTLTTTKAPSYGVTYDDNDDLNVVYEETKETTTTIPAVTYKFGFVDEKGALVAPTNFNMTTNLTTIMNGTSKQVGTASGVNNGNLKQLTIPSQQLTYTPTVSPAYSGGTNFRVTVPKRYKLPTVKPGSYYTGSSTAYPIATTRMRYVGGVLPDDRLVTDGSDYTLATTTTAHSYRIRQLFWESDTTKTVFDLILSTANATGNAPAYYTTDETMYYFLENRRVTENFVDTSGAKITAPTGFTQGKKTVITSDAYTFKQAGTLPDTYTTGGKTYKFKGWYKGKTKPSTLTTTKAPSYQVTYDDNDDLNVVYEETKLKTYTLPSQEITFGYVDEQGNLINPANVTVKATMAETTDVDSGTTTTFPTITGTDVTTTKLKKLTVPQKVYNLPESGERLTTYGTQSVTHEIPKYYQTISISPTSNYTGDKTKYPLANEVRKDIENPSTIVSTAVGTTAYSLTKKSGNIYNTRQVPWAWDKNRTLYAMGIYSGNAGRNYNLATPDKTVYYYLENRRVTENFVDTSGAKITPPTGFTQGKKTVITSDAYTFKQAGTLPDTYTTGGKTYKFKGWYKGKSILNTLTTTKAPSYQVTYDDNDDLNVVYEEETVTTFYPSINLNFVNEKGGAFTPALTFSGKYNVQRASDKVITNLYDLTSKSNGNGQYTVSINNGSVPLSHELLKKYNNGSPISTTNSLSFKLDKLVIDQQLKYVDSIRVEAAQSSGLNTYRYDYTHDGSTVIDSSKAPIAINMSTAEINGLNFTTDGTNFSNTNNRFLGMRVGHSVSSTGSNYLLNTDLFSNNPANGAKLVYKVTRKQVTENFVDANGAKITAPTGFTQGNQVPMNSNTFKYTAAQALPATYTTGGKVYTFQGWYKGKTKPSTLNKTTTPTFNATFDGNDDMTAMYKEEIPTASVTLTRPKEVIDTNTNVIWTTTITNTSKAPLQNLTLKKGPNWSAGLTIPTFMEVTPEGETTKSIPVNSTLWTDGVSLPNAVPIGKKVSVAFTTRATGNPNTFLKAEVVVFGGIKDRTVDNFVRIRPNDQEVVTPTTEGFISVPTFDFGQVGVAGSKQQHNLKQAADYYGNGTRNPYVRIKKTQPNWSLTAQLSQPKSATDSLPTATRLLLGAAPVSSFTNYNQPTELKNAVGTTSAISLTANNTATSIIANKQFTGSNVYQLDFTFNNVKLEVPANQGVKGQQYKAAVTWNLVTGP
ncbi:WxL domain-containing protein [Enterococcus faecalis]|uniref:WxL domain-containing protein n=1 Tax=Enterococcus faecalis TaxID=1351 RepID=UPI003A599262